MRICVRTDADVTRREREGKVVYESDEMASRWIDLWDVLYDNNTFSFSKQDYAICHARIMTNESDITTEWYTPSDNETSFSVPAPNMPQVLSMLGGYDLLNVTKKDVASALHSYQLLSSGCYMGALICFLTILILAIGVKLFNHYRHLKLLEMLETIDNGLHYKEMRMWKKKITQKRYKRHLVKKQVASFIRGSDYGSKWAGYLVTLLTFYLLIHFCSVYSSSKIILSTPEVVDTYAMLVEHETAVGSFLDFMVNVSSLFEKSPVASVKKRIWMKNQSSRRMKYLRGLDDFHKNYLMMRDDGSVLIGASTFIRVVKSMFCAVSPEGQLRHLVIAVDPSEQEKLYGFPLAIHLKSDKTVTLKLRLMVELGFFKSLMGRWVDRSFEQAEQLVGTSNDHLLKQKLVCAGEMTADVRPPAPVNLPYWASLIYLLLAIDLLALVVLGVEKILA